MIPASGTAVSRPSWLDPAVYAAYFELAKPRIIVLLLITTLAAMIMAARGLPPLDLLFWTLVGGALSSASSGAFNCWYDRDIDPLMRRTASRPLPTGRLQPWHALAYATVTAMLAYAVLGLFVNPLAMGLAMFGQFYYCVIYTIWLKRSTPMNIVIGGGAGAVPPLVGWAAVTHQIGAPALGLFAVIFLWTPPHFWALALNIETEFEKAGIPMLPNVAGERYTRIQIFGYTVALVAATLLFYPMHILGAVFFGAAALLGAYFLLLAIRILRRPMRASYQRMFRYSLIYLALICVAMVVDRVV
ncbi:MAG TPA: heme o synthase [Candidatus Dormibacteraeota bacterium]|nr:heme o synthase [Candidatus Dormibacteraeota bacterium]